MDKIAKTLFFSGMGVVNEDQARLSVDERHMNNAVFAESSNAMSNMSARQFFLYSQQ